MFPGIGPRERGKLDLPPFAFRQCIRPRVPMHQCVGTFWNSETSRPVRIKMGEVTVKPPFAYWAAPSGNCLKAFVAPFEGEGAAHYANSFPELRPEALAEDGAEGGQKSPGPYVIPGQSATGCAKQQKRVGKNPTEETNQPDFEWSAEKCARELC